MTEQLEAEVRAALHDRAAHVPAVTVARLTRVDYHPRTRRLRPRLAIGGLAGAAGAAGAVAAVISLTAGASSAFAGWSATPTLPKPGQLAAASSDCQTQSPIAGLPLELTDTRGPFTFSIYADSQSSASCIKGPSFTAVSGNTSSAPINVAAGQILLSSEHMTTRGGDAYSFADGRAGDGVSAVTLVLADGTDVQATVENGWFVAWWPSTSDVKSAQVTTPSGTTTQSPDSGRQANPCGAAHCSSSGFGGVVGSSSGGSPRGGSSMSEVQGSSAP
jgi:hypothetical protein